MAEPLGDTDRQGGLQRQSAPPLGFGDKKPRRSKMPTKRRSRSAHPLLHLRCAAELSRIRSRRRLRRRWPGTGGGLWPWGPRPPRAEPPQGRLADQHGSFGLQARKRAAGRSFPVGPSSQRPDARSVRATWLPAGRAALRYRAIGHLGADDRRRCKAPHQTAARLWYACGTASRAAVTAGQQVQVTVPGQRTRKAALDTFLPADRSAAVSPMGEWRRDKNRGRVPGRCFCGCGPLSLAAGDASRQDVHDGVSCGCPMILAASARARRGGRTNAWT